MFSTVNMSNLYSLYCNSTLNLEIIEQNKETTFGEEALSQQYSHYFNTLNSELEFFYLSNQLVEKQYVQRPKTEKEVILEFILAAMGVGGSFLTLAERLGAHLPHIAENIMHLVEKIGEMGHKIPHVQPHEQKYNTFQEIQGDAVKAFIHHIVGELTYSFRHELLIASPQDCKKHAHTHFKQIKTCLNSLSKEGTGLNANQLIEFIVQKINPDPMEQIKARIDEYIQNRGSRTFCSKSRSREDFLEDFQSTVQKPETNLETVIHHLSRLVFFKDDCYKWKRNNIGKTLYEQNQRLGNDNLLLEGLNLYQYEPLTTFPAQLPTTFNNPFLTAFFYNHIRMNHVARDILVLTMRLHVIKTIKAGTPETTRISDITRKVINHLAHPELKPIYQRLETIETTVDELRTRFDDMEATMTSDLSLLREALKARPHHSHQTSRKVRRAVPLITLGGPSRSLRSSDSQDTPPLESEAL